MTNPQIENLEKVAGGFVKVFLQQWFEKNQDNLEDAVANFLPLSSASREERAIQLIAQFATVER